MGYKGCRGFNESVLSRMRMIHYCEPFTVKGMVERVQKRVTGMEQETLEKMAETVREKVLPDGDDYRRGVRIPGI